MREIERIPRICKLLERWWLGCPDQRFGQMLTNYVPEFFKGEVDIFFQEDDITERRMNALIKKAQGPKTKKSK